MLSQREIKEHEEKRKLNSFCRYLRKNPDLFKEHNLHQLMLDDQNKKAPNIELKEELKEIPPIEIIKEEPEPEKLLGLEEIKPEEIKEKKKKEKKPRKKKEKKVEEKIELPIDPPALVRQCAELELNPVPSGPNPLEAKLNLEEHKSNSN